MTKPADGAQNGFVLRLSVPASGELAAVAPEMGAKLAEQLGLDPAHTSRITEAMADLAQRVEPGGAGDVSYEFHKQDADLKIEARHDGRTAEARVPLHA